MEIDVLGVSFDNITLSQAVEAGAAMAGEGFHYVVTPNPELVSLSWNDEAYRAALAGADLTLPDGIGIIHAARILGRPLTHRVPGIDFAWGLAERLADRGGRLFLLGAKPGVADEAARRLTARFPGLVICGTQHGYFTEDAPVIQAIRAAGADVVFVCLGAPRQELWISQNGPASGAHLMVGLGGAMDVFAGTVKRAPEGWQRLGLEWLYRLLRQPSRIPRMAKLPLFLVRAAQARRKGDAAHAG